ncbi:MAG TPA: MG2 domain-containing protein [Steroidobacteraceae bacterium]|nr:MG2 domain-containing protein [Steroidobacteraceae bacterium]
MRIPGLWIGLLVQLVALPLLAQEARAPSAQVELFSPQGTARQVRQVTARFTAPIVTLGDPRLPDPFDVQCPGGPGQGRWADPRNWVYDFDEDLPAGLRCTFTLRPQLRTAAGGELTGTRKFSFDTGGPGIAASYPREGWEAIDEEQVFLLRLDAAASPQSIEEHAQCVVQGIEERIGVDVLSGEERAAVLKARRLLGYQYFQLLWKNGAVTHARLRGDELDQAEQSIAVVRCKRRLPPATQVRLNWGAGIATLSGIATTQDQQLAFKVRPAFTVQVECTRANARAGCTPTQPVVVSFASPVPRDLALGVRIKTSDGEVLSPEDKDSKSAPTLERVAFSGPFPEESTAIVMLPAGIVDDSGRPLSNAARFPLELRIDAFPALARFAADFGILEAKQGGVLPVTLRNVEAEFGGQQPDLPAKMLRVDADPAAIADWLQRVANANRSAGEWIAPAPGEQPAEDGQSTVWREATGTSSVFAAADQTTAFTLKKPAGGKPAEVIGIPLRKPGFYVVEIGSRALGRSLLGRDQLRYVTTGALVTNLSVHFNWGRESSTAWVTQLDDGQPVAGAAITIVDYCRRAILWQGKTGADGLAAIADSFGEPHNADGCWSDRVVPLLVLAQRDADFAFTLSSWNQGITPDRFGLNTGGEWNADIYHTVLDRALFRAGEKVSMKHFLRRHASPGIVLPEPLPTTRKVAIMHLGSGQKYELDAGFGADGIAESEWTIPAEAKLGDYSVSIVDGYPRQSASFKVEQFRLPSMRASVIGSPRPLVRQKSAVLDLHVAYMSGGGAAGLPAKLRTVVEPAAVSYAGYDDYRFGGGAVREGIVTGDDSYFYEDSAEPPAQPGKVQVLPITLDGEGAARVTVGDLPQLQAASQLTAELEYEDANGELLTATGRVRLVPAALSVGIRPEAWVASEEQLRFRVVVLDLDGKPRAQQPVQVALYRSSAYSYRKRLIGGFYAYETTRETTRLAATCKGQTNEQGLLICDVAPGISGEVVARAETVDAEHNVAGATTSFWVAGKDDWWFGGTQGDRMDLLPEKKEYSAGETARFQVRMPFRQATALVTVEREGVLSSFVTRLKGQMPVIEVPIADSYAPNVFVAVLAVRGRVGVLSGGKSQREAVTALVDLNKPAYRLGMAKINVGWKPHRLNVTVTPQKKVLEVAEKATVNVHVEREDGAVLPADSEIAVAVVDEALLELSPNPSWDLLAAMMGERGVEVWTSTAQMQVVGKRHYGRKAAPHGGGGGRERDRAREQFDSLLLWKGRVKLDGQGNAVVPVTLNDSLTSFRIVAVANGAAHLFGTGSATINTTQDLILMSGLAPLVREGDRYAATFTLRNTTNRALTVDAQARLALDRAPTLAPQRVEIPAGHARDVVWRVTAPVGVEQLKWEVAAREVNGTAGDKIRLTQSVIPAYPVRTYQATIAQLAAPLSLPAERPADAVKGRGGLEVTLRAKLGDGLDGVREYMSWYPFTCIEQRLSQAVALRNESLWLASSARLPAYMDADGLLKYFPTDRLEGDDALTAYVLVLAHEAGWQIAEADQRRMIDALTRFVAGRIVRRSALPTADLAIRKLAAIAALARYEAAPPQMLDSIQLQPDIWPTSAVLDWIDILKRVKGIARGDDRRKAALQILRTRLNFQGTTMGFSTEHSDALWWLMISADSNANRMLMSVLDEPQWREDIPRLVRGSLGRQQRGHWNTTVANALGVLAMEKFSAAFESTPVSGSSGIRYGSQQTRITWPRQSNSKQVDLPWQDGPASLDVSHEGAGQPWVMIRATAALPLRKPLSSGYKITRSVTPVDQQVAGRWTRGDVARVRLEIEAQSDMAWVAVEDPIPGGATVMGSGLGGQSALLTREERREGYAWLAFEERRFDSFRAYYRYVPKGRWVVEYTLRLNNPGEFLLPATRVEAMYAPEMFGESPNAAVTVEAQP